MSWPVRTGLPTVHNLIRIVKRILNKYLELYNTILTETQVTKILNLLDCIQEVLDDVPTHEPLP